MHHRLLVVVVAILTAVQVGTRPAAAAGPTVNGGGSSFVGIEVDAWRSDVARPPYSVTVNYQSTGSTFGRLGFIDGTLDFGISDIQFQPGESPDDPNSEVARVQKFRPHYTYIPISAGGVAFMYQLRDGSGLVQDLKLSPRTVCGIFTGFVKKWNDPAIVTDTGHPMPDTDIFPVVRADGSGQSFVLAQYCIEHAPDVWDLFIDDQNRAAGRTVYPKATALSEWPKSFGKSRSANFSDGVADAVADQNADGAITYVETGFAEQRKFPVASVKNESGVYTQPTAENVTNALRFARVREDKTHLLSFRGPGEKVYYPSTYSYLIAQTDGFDPAKGKTLATFINYSCTKGQLKATQLGYAPLSPNLIDVCLDETQRIPGAPARPATTSGEGLENTGGPGGTTGGTTSSGGTSGTSSGTSSGAGGTTGGTSGATGGSTTGGTSGATGGTTVTTRSGSASGTRSTTATTRAGTRTARGGTSGSVSAAAAELPSTGVVDPEVGPLGASGGEHAILGALGAVLAVTGAWTRRRSLHRAS